MSVGEDGKVNRLAAAAIAAVIVVAIAASCTEPRPDPPPATSPAEQASAEFQAPDQAARPVMEQATPTAAEARPAAAPRRVLTFAGVGGLAEPAAPAPLELNTSGKFAVTFTCRPPADTRGESTGRRVSALVTVLPADPDLPDMLRVALDDEDQTADIQAPAGVVLVEARCTSNIRADDPSGYLYRRTPRYYPWLVRLTELD